MKKIKIEPVLGSPHLKKVTIDEKEHVIDKNFAAIIHMMMCMNEDICGTLFDLFSKNNIF